MADAYLSTIPASGTMSTISSTFYPTKYFVDGQGLYLPTGSTAVADASTLTLGSITGQAGFSVVALTKGAAAPSTGGFSMTSGGGDSFSVTYDSSTSITVTINGQSQTFTGIDNYASDSLAYGISVFETIKNSESRVCLSAPTGFESCLDIPKALDPTSSYSLTFTGEQHVNDIEFFDVPFSSKELSARIATTGCGTTNSPTACLSCLADSPECPTICANTEYYSAGACTACPTNCLACWGDVVDECYGCTAASLITYVEADTTCNECGDSYRYTTENCDDGNIVSGDGCSATCTVETPYTCALGVDMVPDTCTVSSGSAYRIEYKSSGSNPSDSDGTSTGTTVAIMDTPTTFAVTGTSSLQPGPMGAIMDGKSIGCSGSNQADTFTGVPFTVTMWVYLPQVTTKMYLYCDIMLHTDSTVSERFCLSVSAEVSPGHGKRRHNCRF